jgi:spoIIIJ-associated protein
MAEGREFEGKDLQAVLEEASASTGIAEPDLDYEIVEQGRKGLFGVGAKSIRIRVIPPMPPIHDELLDGGRDERPKPAGAGARRRGRGRGRRDDVPADEAGRETAAGEGAAESARQSEEGSAPRPREGGRRSRRGRRRGRGRDRQRPREERRPSKPQEHPPVDASPEDIASVGETLQKMVDLMGLELRAEAGPAEWGVRVELDGEDMGLMVQKDGQLMSSVQFLLNRMARRTWPEAGRIQLSAQGQLERRDDELVELTREVANQVATTGESKRLHEMNAYERRLVHITIREYEDLGSRSEGNGHLKRVRVFKR